MSYCNFQSPAFTRFGIICSNLHGSWWMSCIYVILPDRRCSGVNRENSIWCGLVSQLVQTPRYKCLGCVYECEPTSRRSKTNQCRSTSKQCLSRKSIIWPSRNQLSYCWRMKFNKAVGCIHEIENSRFFECGKIRIQWIKQNQRLLVQGLQEFLTSNCWKANK